MTAELIRVVSIAALWVMFLSSIRFFGNSLLNLRPLGVAFGRVVLMRMHGKDARREWSTAFDQVYMTMNIALTTPWSVVLLFSGMCMMAAGYSFGSTGDVMVLVARYPDRWMAYDRYLDWISVLVSCIGMAAALAAISARPRASALISCGFAITGLGIGILASYYI